uniref:Uncharacterized protein n=1 Tax=Arundo donax TaxID=35708 RepID=A0A0A8XZH7_ARUDO
MASEVSAEPISIPETEFGLGSVNSDRQVRMGSSCVLHCPMMAFDNLGERIASQR